MGQIVFIYFLQRKKWLGGNPSNKKWDDGKKDFLRWAFNYCEQNNLNFFDSFLESLFYKGFNEKNDSFEINNTYIKVPFLNGGLFEKFYQSDETLILHPPNSLFSNKEETGILDIFDKYNFTIDENTFFEQEVAVDPEMLGKVFENLLPENLRKGKGTYYTPREIVSYMTRESLINFLKIKLQKEDCDDTCIDKKIRQLFEYKDFYISKKESEEFGQEFEKQFYEMIDIVEEANTYLKDIRIVDPAVGSGAFPMGILLEIVSLRQYIESEFLDNKKISIYELKKETIQNSIYGVDIDPGAVEIAKLRFWLSLVVDAEEPEPLPNLDYKIMQGNSLMESYEGVDLSNIAQENDMTIIEPERDLFGNIKEEQLKITITKSETLKKIQRLMNSYFSINDIQKKENVKKTINQKIHEHIDFNLERQEMQLKRFVAEAGNPDNLTNSNKRKKLKKKIDNWNREIEKLIQKRQNLYEIQNKDEKPYFLWHLFFSEIFEGENSGFDIVIANPPYVQLQKDHGYLADLYKDQNFETFTRTGDIYCLFYEQGFNLLTDLGHLCYITSNKWMRANYGNATRNFFATKTNPKRLIDFGGYQVFEHATVDSNILLFAKEENKHKTLAVSIGKDYKKGMSIADYLSNNFVVLDELSEDSWVISSKLEMNIKKKIERLGTPLKDWDISINFGIKTGCNEVFIIDRAKKDELIAVDPKNAEVIKPILRGRDIKRYKAEFADLWLIATFPAKHYNIDDYPIVKKYLEQFLPKLNQTGEIYIDKKGEEQKTRKKTSNKWFETQDQIGYYEELNRDKIVWKRIGSIMRFSYEISMKLCLDSTCFATGEKIPYLSSILNSKLLLYRLLKTSPKTGTGDQIISVQAIEPLPVVYPNSDIEKLVCTIFDQILIDKKAGKDTQKLEDKIDLMVYKLYELTYEEAKIVDTNLDRVLAQFGLNKEDYKKMGVGEIAELTSPTAWFE